MQKQFLRFASILLTSLLGGHASVDSWPAPFALEAISAPASAAQFSEPLSKRGKIAVIVESPHESMISARVFPWEESVWREKIAKESDDVMVSNMDSVELVQERAGRLLHRRPDIRALLERSGVKPIQIMNIIHALRTPSVSFQWFDAVIMEEGTTKYILGTESALAANFIRYLQNREINTGEADLIDEYVFLKVIERSNLEPVKIRSLAHLYFNRGHADPLDDAVSHFARTGFRGYGARLTLSDALTLAQDRYNYQQKMKSAPSWAEKAQIYFEHLDRLDLFVVEVTCERMMQFLLGPLREDFADYSDSVYGSVAVTIAMEALIELDIIQALSFFIELLAHPDPKFRFSAAGVLTLRFHWKPTDLVSKAMFSMAKRQWAKLAKFGRKHPEEALNAYRLALLGLGLTHTVIHQLVQMGPLGEGVLLEALQDSGEESDKVAILKGLEQMPIPSLEAIAVAEELVQRALEIKEDQFAIAAAPTLQNLRRRRAEWLTSI